jgi:hypothetical protein
MRRVAFGCELLALVNLVAFSHNEIDDYIGAVFSLGNMHQGETSGIFIVCFQHTSMSMSWLIGMHVHRIHYVFVMSERREERGREDIPHLDASYALMKNEEKTEGVLALHRARGNRLGTESNKDGVSQFSEARIGQSQTLMFGAKMIKKYVLQKFMIGALRWAVKGML